MPSFVAAMVPPTSPLHLDVEAVSGICGSVSIACWVVVFSPQIIENFRRGSADGLSLQFLIIWLAGDVFNILGAVLQGVLPTMIILAVYYTLADIVLLGQCFYYRGFTWRDEVVATPVAQRRRQRGTPGDNDVSERSALLAGGWPRERRGSDWSTLSHLSPAMPLVADISPPKLPPTRLQAAAFNTLAVLMVCGAGVGGWYLSRGYGQDPPPPPLEHDSDGGVVAFDLWGQVFGYLCAVLYLGSRLPQLLLNWRRKSTEGVSMLFFLFACLGNLTYVLSIFAYEPGEGARDYWTYILVNLSWLVGSLGTLLLDMGIFVQFFIYGGQENDGDADSLYESDDEDREVDDGRWDQRPLLERNLSSGSA